MGMLGLCYYYTGNKSLGLKLIGKFLELDNQYYADIYHWIGVLFADELRNIPEGIRLITLAIEYRFGENNRYDYLRRGMLYFRLKENEKAKMDLLTSLEISEKSNDKEGIVEAKAELIKIEQA